jgi:hypothetical protein
LSIDFDNGNSLYLEEGESMFLKLPSSDSEKKEFLKNVFTSDMSKIKTKSPCYPELVNPTTIFEYVGYKTKEKKTRYYDNNVPYYQSYYVYYYKFKTQNYTYIFTQKSLEYAVSFVPYEKNLQTLSEKYNYIDTKYAPEDTKLNQSKDRFVKVVWNSVILSNDQKPIYNFSVGSDNYGLDITNINKIIVSDTKFEEMTNIASRVKNQYINKFKYIDVKHCETSLDQTNLVCDRFIPMQVVGIDIDAARNVTIMLNIDNKIWRTTEDGLLHKGVPSEVVDRCAEVFRFVKSAKSQYKYIDIAFDDYVKKDVAKSPNLLFGNYIPINVLSAETDEHYDVYVNIIINSRYYRIPITDFKKFAVKQQEMENIYTTQRFFEENFKGYTFKDAGNVKKYFGDSGEGILVGALIDAACNNAVSYSETYTFFDCKNGLQATRGDINAKKIRLETESDFRALGETFYYASALTEDNYFSYKIVGNVIEITKQIKEYTPRTKAASFRSYWGIYPHDKPMYIEFWDYNYYKKYPGEIGVLKDGKLLPYDEWEEMRRYMAGDWRLEPNRVAYRATKERDKDRNEYKEGVAFYDYKITETVPAYTIKEVTTRIIYSPEDNTLRIGDKIFVRIKLEGE